MGSPLANWAFYVRLVGLYVLAWGFVYLWFFFFRGRTRRPNESRRQRALGMGPPFGRQFLTLRRRRARYLELGCAFVGLGVLILIFAQAYPHAPVPPPIHVTCSSSSECIPPVVVSTPPSAGVPWIVLLVVSLVVICGLILLAPEVRVGEQAKRAAAASLIIGTLTAGGFTVFKEVKFENLLGKVDISIVEERLKEAAPRRLGSIECFATGESKIPDDVKIDPKSSDREHCTTRANAVSYLNGKEEWTTTSKLLADICEKENGASLILMVGAPDRAPLRRALLKQYESNVGLAQARAGEVAKRLHDGQGTCKIAEDRLLAMASGPVHTQKDPKNFDYAQDRKVDLWAIGIRETARRPDQADRWWRWESPLWPWLLVIVITIAWVVVGSRRKKKEPITQSLEGDFDSD